MIYDLHLTMPIGRAAPTPSEVTEALAASGHWAPFRADGWRYENPETGVVLGLVRTDVDAGLTERSAGLTVRMALVRPSVFGDEFRRVVAGLVRSLDVMVMDPQLDDPHGRVFDAERFHGGWSAHNAQAVRASASGLFRQRTLPGDKLRAMWRWNDRRAAVQSTLGEEIFVPRVRLADDQGDTVTCVIWTDGLPIALPYVDAVLLCRMDAGPDDGRPQRMTLVRIGAVNRLGLEWVEDALTPDCLLGPWTEPPRAVRQLFGAEDWPRGFDGWLDAGAVVDAELLGARD